jgi:hypothetical protein
MEHHTYFTSDISQHLEEHGWARIWGVLPRETTDDFKADVESYFTTWDPDLTFDRPQNWSSSKLPPGTIHGINKIGGHAWFMWQLRQRPEVMKLWSEYFGCTIEDLRVSYDGFCVCLAETPRRAANGYWGHFDHGTSFVPYRCLQSIVIMEDCTDAERDGGLVVWDKSHCAHDGYFRVKGIECKENWYRFPHEDGDRNKPQPELEADGRPYLSPGDPDYGSELPVPMPRTVVRAQAGDVIVWFSDTAHQNQPPNAGGRNRVVAYVSMAPRQYLLPARDRTAPAGVPRQGHVKPLGGRWL